VVEHPLVEHQVGEDLLEARPVDGDPDVGLAGGHGVVVGDRHGGRSGVLVDLEELPGALATGGRDRELHAGIDRLVIGQHCGPDPGRGAVALVSQELEGGLDKGEWHANVPGNVTPQHAAVEVEDLQD
jgi:hypothetical protein